MFPFPFDRFGPGFSGTKRTGISYHKVTTKEDFLTHDRIFHHEDINNVASDLRFKLDIEDIAIGLQCIQYHYVVKVGCIFRMLDKINRCKWTESPSELSVCGL